LNAQRVFALVKKDLKKLVREPAILFLIILFPVVFTLGFGASFGAVGGDQSTTYKIGLVNNDSGDYPIWPKHFIGNLTSTEILLIQTYSDNDAAQSDLTQVTSKEFY